MRPLGFEIRRYYPHHDPWRRLLVSLERHGVNVALDVGANVGQFAASLRRAGYTGRMISFEPLSAAHAKLAIAARDDPLWTVAPRCALAAKSGVAEINIAANSQSSSILDMLERHVAGDPKSAYLGREAVATTTLDDFLDHTPDAAGAAIALKLDTQGYEAEVLAGLDKWRGNIEVIMTEISLVGLYKGEATFLDLYRMIEERGYRCISIEPGFTDPRTSEVLQVDAIFERDHGRGKGNARHG